MTMFCTRCGNPVSEDDRFCRKCGAQLDPPQMPSDHAQNSNNNDRRRQSVTVKERRTAPPENEKMKIILPLAILTIVLFSFIIVLIVLLNRPEPEPVPRTSSRVSSVESASIEPETTTTTIETTTETTTTTQPPTEADRILIQDLASFSDGEVRAEPAAVSENNTSIVYYPAETGGDMYYYVLEWMDYLKKDSKLTYVGASGSNVLYTSYYDCNDSSIEKKKTKVDGKTKKQDYVMSLVIVNDPNSNAVLSVTANMSKGLNVDDLDFRFSGESMTTAATSTTTKKNEKRTTTTTHKATTVKTTSTTSSTTRRQTETTTQPTLTSTYLQDLKDFAGGDVKIGDQQFNDDGTAISYEASDNNSDITDAVNMWLQYIFDSSDFNYAGIRESNGHIIYYFDYDSGKTDKPKVEMDNENGKKEYSLEIDCICKDSDTITKVNIRACQGINIVDMGERF